MMARVQEHVAQRRAHLSGRAQESRMIAIVEDPSAAPAKVVEFLTKAKVM